MNPTREVIDSTLTYCAEHCDSQEESDLIAWVAEKFEETLALDE